MDLNSKLIKLSTDMQPAVIKFEQALNLSIEMGDYFKGTSLDIMGIP